MADKEKYLGEFEQILLLALVRLDQNAYGSKIRKLLSELINRDVSIGALYATLERLETKALVKSYKGPPTPERGGRAKKYFEVTPLGYASLRRSKDALDVMWSGVSLSRVEI